MRREGLQVVLTAVEAEQGCEAWELLRRLPKQGVEAAAAAAAADSIRRHQSQPRWAGDLYHNWPMSSQQLWRWEMLAGNWHRCLHPCTLAC